MLSIPGSPGVLRRAAKEVLREPSVLACALVDLESGRTLDTETADRARLDTEAVAAAQAEVIRAAQALAQVVRGAPTEVVVKQGSAVLHLIRLLADEAGPGLVLSVLVLTPERNLRKVRRALDRLDPAALRVARPRAVPGPNRSGSARNPVPAARTGAARVRPRVTVPHLADLADRPGLSDVDWFTPVTPGSPPPLRPIVAEPEQPHLHVGPSHRSAERRPSAPAPAGASGNRVELDL